MTARAGRPARPTTYQREQRAQLPAQGRTIADALTRAATTARAATYQRDQLILARAQEGASLRQIASEAGLTHTAIARILQRTEPNP